MRFFGADDGCGPLLELGHIQRALHLGAPVDDGEQTIAVAQIVGSVGRARDFDGCFRPRWPSLKKRIEEIQLAAPSSLDEPIDVIRVDRAYFVSDGHKRVAIAKQTEREFIDARVSRLPSPYALAPNVAEEAIERTAREGEFRRHSGLLEAVPQARFAVTDITAYGELLLAVQAHAYDRSQREGRFVAPAEAARAWYEQVYLPTIAEARESGGRLLETCADADIFLMWHRHERGSWGSLCDEPDCIADMVLAQRRRDDAAARSAIDRLLQRDAGSVDTATLLLPSAEEEA